MAGKFLSAGAAVLLALGCSPAASADCVVTSSRPSTIDGVFADIPGVTVTPGCPAIPSPFAGADMAAATAGEISRDGASVMTVFAGELAAGDGQAFVHDRFLAAAQGAASDTQTVGGYPVTYFNILQLGDGYAYADGPSVVIAYDTGSPPTQQVVREVLPVLLARIRPS